MEICEEMYETNDTFWTHLQLLFSHFYFHLNWFCEMYTYVFFHREQLSVLYINRGVNVEHACPHTLENLAVFIFGTAGLQ